MVSARTESSTLFLLAASIIINRPLELSLVFRAQPWRLAAGCRSSCRTGFLRGLAACARVPLHSVAERGLGGEQARGGAPGVRENLSLAIGLRAWLWIAALFYPVAGIGLRNASTSESTVFHS